MNALVEAAADGDVVGVGFAGDGVVQIAVDAINALMEMPKMTLFMRRIDPRSRWNTSPFPISKKEIFDPVNKRLTGRPVKLDEDERTLSRQLAAIRNSLLSYANPQH